MADKRLGVRAQGPRTKGNSEVLRAGLGSVRHYTNKMRTQVSSEDVSQF